MRHILVVGLLALSVLPVRAQTLRGDYVEARTCSVYAGGCHYSGEYVTAVREDRQITVEAPGVAVLNISRYPCKHCVQPHQVWYQPLAPIKEAEVASAKHTAYLDRQLGTVWQRGEENSVFVGEFAVAK